MECDLCGSKEPGMRYYALEFDIEGKICSECREDLREERAEKRERELGNRNYLNTAERIKAGRDTDRTIRLPVLNPPFHYADLTLRSAVAVTIAQTRSVFRPRPTSPRLTASPCFAGQTVEGHIHEGQTRPQRISGKAFGMPGLLCRNCYGKYRQRWKRRQATANCQAGAA